MTPTSIQADFKGGRATEYTYRSALENLLETLHDHVEASNDLKHIKCGAPDFIVERRKVPLGYVETKDVGDDLDKTEKSDQLKRYRASLNNLILTDYLEFRWYINGIHRLTARIADVGKGYNLSPMPLAWLPPNNSFNSFIKLKRRLPSRPRTWRSVWPR